LSKFFLMLLAPEFRSELTAIRQIEQLVSRDPGRIKMRRLQRG
jgi:hypothetical protein